MTNFVDLFGFFESGTVCVDQKERGPFGALTRVCNGGNDHEICVNAVGDKNLRPVQDPLIAIADGVGANALNIGACARLGHGEGTDYLAFGHAGQPKGFLLLGAVTAEIGCDDVVVDTIARCEAAEAHLRQLFDHGERDMG